jgi:hypothetical protein
VHRVISGVAFCPQPPLLVPAVASGAAGELEPLRAACRTALRRVAAGRRLVLLGDGPQARAHDTGTAGSFAPFGVPYPVRLGAAGDGVRPADAILPPSLTVGAWLAADALGPASGAVAFEVGPGFAAGPAADRLRALAAGEDVALLVLGDGSATRTERAPGYYDARSAAFDASVAAALASGDATALAAIDAGLAAELHAAGGAAWHAAADVLVSTGCARFAAEVLYADAPYGVGYVVAAWTAGG